MSYVRYKSENFYRWETEIIIPLIVTTAPDALYLNTEEDCYQLLCDIFHYHPKGIPDLLVNSTSDNIEMMFNEELWVLMVNSECLIPLQILNESAQLLAYGETETDYVQMYIELISKHLGIDKEVLNMTLYKYLQEGKVDVIDRVDN